MYIPSPLSTRTFHEQIVNGEAENYFEITCRAAISPRVLNLCRQLSSLFEGQHVQIETPPGSELSACTLRVRIAEEAPRSYWPSIQSLLEDSKLLDTCSVVLHDAATDETIQLWPAGE